MVNEWIRTVGMSILLELAYAIHVGDINSEWRWLPIVIGSPIISAGSIIF
jgi:hypothetical protein